jgi:inner membrane protein YhjD
MVIAGRSQSMPSSPSALTIIACAEPAVWERKPDDKEKIWKRYIRDFLSLTGLMLALVITLSLTSVAGSAQAMIVSALGLDGIDWLIRPVSDRKSRI